MSVIEWDKRIHIRADRKREIEEAVDEIWNDAVGELPESGHIGVELFDMCPKIVIEDSFYDLKAGLSEIDTETVHEEIKGKAECYNELLRLYDNIKSSPEELFEALDDIASCDSVYMTEALREALALGYRQMNNIYSTYIPFCITGEAYDKLQIAVDRNQTDEDKGHVFIPAEVRQIFAEKYYRGHEIHICYRQFIKSACAYKLIKAALARELFKAALCISSFSAFGDKADNIFYDKSRKPHQLVSFAERESIYNGLSEYFAYSWCDNQKDEEYKVIAFNIKKYWEKHLVFKRNRWQKNAIELTTEPIWSGSAAALIDNSDQAAQIVDAVVTGGPGGNLYHARFLMLVVPKKNEENQEF